MELSLAYCYIHCAEWVLEALAEPADIDPILLNEIRWHLNYIYQLRDKVARSYGFDLLDQLTPTVRYVIQNLEDGKKVLLQATRPNDYYALIKVLGKPDRTVHISVVMACLVCFEQQPGLRNHIMDGHDLVLSLKS